MATFTSADILICPLDQQPLVQEGNSLKCCSGHSFDIARQGYVNLLPVQKKKSKDPGDSKAMIQARKRFLQAGLYQPVSDRLNSLVHTHLPAEQSGRINLLDAGCGEGYYLSRLATAQASDQRQTLQLIGLDISKWGPQTATQYQLPITWLVGTNAQLPVADHSLDLIICMFGFWQPEWFARALKPGGKVILADAGAGHLIELREIIYDEVRRKPEPGLKGAENTGFSLLDRQQLDFPVPTLNREQIQDLLTMTPHLYRASYEGKQKVQNLSALDLSAQVVFRILEYTPDSKDD